MHTFLSFVLHRHFRVNHFGCVLYAHTLIRGSTHTFCCVSLVVFWIHTFGFVSLVVFCIHTFGFVVVHTHFVVLVMFVVFVKHTSWFIVPHTHINARIFAALLCNIIYWYCVQWRRRSATVSDRQTGMHEEKEISRARCKREREEWGALLCSLLLRSSGSLFTHTLTYCVDLWPLVWLIYVVVCYPSGYYGDVFLNTSSHTHTQAHSNLVRLLTLWFVSRHALQERERSGGHTMVFSSR